MIKEMKREPGSEKQTYQLDEIKTAIRNRLRRLSGSEVTFLLSEAPGGLGADYGINLSAVAAQTGRSLPDLAGSLQSIFSAPDNPWLERVESKGPFLNFKLEMGQFGAKVVDQVLQMGADYGTENIGKGKIVAIDMSSPNIAKRMSYGHLRSTIIGDALANLNEAQGYKSIKDNHIGDWGTQFGKLMIAIQKWSDEKTVLASDDPIGLMQELYIKFDSEATSEKSVLKDKAKVTIRKNGTDAIPGLTKIINERKQALASKEIDEDKVLEYALDKLITSPLEDEGRAWFLKLEQGDPEARRLWKMCVDLSITEFNKIYSILGVNFDVTLGESFYEDKMAAVIKEVKEAGIGKLSNGALVVDMSDKKLGVAIIQKTDGATLYMTRDLACALYREAQMGADRALYVVGEDQKQYFQQLFEVLKRMGHKLGVGSEHVYFGMVRLEEGKMSTRKGRTILLKDVIEEGFRRAERIIESKGRSQAEPEAKKDIVRQIAVGSLKWNDLAQDPRRPIVFDWDKAINLEGNSAPYVQYAGVRARRILETAGVDAKTLSRVSQSQDKEKYHSEPERSLIKAIALYPQAVTEACTSNNPSKLATHTYEIAKRFNLFYNSTQVLKVDDPKIKDSRIRLVASTLQVISNGLKILGIEVPEVM